MSKSSPSRQGKEEWQKGNSMCQDTSVPGLTPFPGDPDSTGNIPTSKALFNKQPKCKPNHNSFIGVRTLSPENFSAGCKHSIRFLESRRFLSRGTTRNLAPFSGESGSKILFSPHGALAEKCNHFVWKVISRLLHSLPREVTSQKT
uniref:Uncharacterized protein n=1 Tax=Equus caballus TaxID=9796 RepID=A0A9L0S337_HORSE